MSGRPSAPLSPVRQERLASAFELSRAEVRTDAATILDWSGASSDLEAVLAARHGWATDEPLYFIRWVRLEVWCTRNRVPERRSSTLKAL